jgi:hypothetical protein
MLQSGLGWQSFASIPVIESNAKQSQHIQLYKVCHAESARPDSNISRLFSSTIFRYLQNDKVYGKK